MADKEDFVEIPPPPRKLGNEDFYFIYGEWLQIRKGSNLATLDNPNPTAPQQRLIGMNECIDMHPLVYFVIAQQTRPGYKIKWALPISKNMYTWFMTVNQLMAEATRKVMENQNVPNSGESVIKES